MTPIELLTEVKARFPILLHDDETALNSLLKQAIAKYQELAGFTEKVRFSEADLNENGAVNTPLLLRLGLPLQIATGILLRAKCGPISWSFG